MVKGMIKRLMAAWALGAMLVAPPMSPVHAADQPKAKEVGARARLALEGHRYAEAADLMDEAFRLDPHPVWLANAGFARMMAGQQDRAVENLSAALQDKELKGDARQLAIVRLGNASTARAHLARADEARARGDLEAAARGFDSAFELVAIGPYALEAADLWERAGNLELAEQRFERAAAMPDLTEPQRRLVTDALKRIAVLRAGSGVAPAVAPAAPPVGPGKSGEEPVEVARRTPERGGPPVLGWVLVGVGVAAVGTGVAAFIISGSEHAAAEDAKAVGDEEARLEHNSRLSTWRNVGIVATSAGVVSAVTGVIMIAVSGDDEPKRALEVGGAPLPGGGLATMRIGF